MIYCLYFVISVLNLSFSASANGDTNHFMENISKQASSLEELGQDLLLHS